MALAQEAGKSRSHRVRRDSPAWAVGALLAFLLALNILSACTGESSTWDRLQSSGILHVGLDPTFPPFEFIGEGRLQGIDVDLAQAIAADLGLEAHFSHFGYDGLYDALATEQVDVLVSALVQEPGRTSDFAYSRGYINSGLVLVSRREAPLTSAMDLHDKSVAVELGALGHVKATTWQRQVPNLAIETYESADEALSTVQERSVDAAVVDNVSARIFVGRRPEAEFEVSPIDDEPYVIVVRREDEKLLEEINRSLSQVSTNGRLDAILDNWFKG